MKMTKPLENASTHRKTSIQRKGKSSVKSSLQPRQFLSKWSFYKSETNIVRLWEERVCQRRSCVGSISEFQNRFEEYGSGQTLSGTFQDNSWRTKYSELGPLCEVSLWNPLLNCLQNHKQTRQLQTMVLWTAQCNLGVCFALHSSLFASATFHAV